MIAGQHPVAVQGKRWLDAALSFFYPEVCQVCGQEAAGPKDGYVGANCRTLVEVIEPPFCGRCGLPFHGAISTVFECAHCGGIQLHFNYARAAVKARGRMLEIIHAYKYKRGLWCEPFLKDLFVAAALPRITAEEWDMIVPVPLHKTRLAEREFNQAERLAAFLAEACALPVYTKAIVRIKATETQTTMTRDQRAQNMRNAFAPHSKGATLVDGKRVVLVDDVFTTGATTNACAKVLRRAGATEVCVWTLARGMLN
jgi:competence protein ComFC